MPEAARGQARQQRRQGGAGLGAGGGGEAADAQQRLAVGPDEPGPDRAVVVGAVAAHHVAIEEGPVVRVGGGEGAQAEGGKKLSAHALDDGGGHLGGER